MAAPSQPAMMATIGLIVVLALGACSTDPSDQDTDDSAPTNTASSSAAPSPTDGGQTPTSSADDDELGAPTDTSPRSQEAHQKGTGPAVVADVRVGAHETYDRVVIDFKPAAGLPDYEIRWLGRKTKPHQPGSGEPITLQGDRALHVRLAATRHRHPGQHDSKPGLTTVRQVRDLGSFEGQTEMDIGAPAADNGAEPVGFRVRLLDGETPRLVIDIAHPGADTKTPNQ